jgi:hypothetical protein
MKRVLMFVSVFKPIKEPEQEANLQTEVEDRTAVSMDRCWRAHEIAVAAVDNVDV